jgi:hypothetical protein
MGTDIEDRGAEARRRLAAAGLLGREERARPQPAAPARIGRPTEAELAWAASQAPTDVSLRHVPGYGPPAEPEPMSEAELIDLILGKPGRL